MREGIRYDWIIAVSDSNGVGVELERRMYYDTNLY